MILLQKFFLLDPLAFLKAQYLYWAIIFFSGVALTLVVSMALMMLGKKNTLRKRSQITAQLEGWIMDVILENNEGTAEGFQVPSEIALLLQNKLAKKVLVRELMKARKSLSGVSGTNLEKLYYQLGLYEISMERMKSKLWHIKSKGIQELAMMNQHDMKSIIFDLTNHTDQMVRMEAQTSMVRLQGYKGLHFFDNLSYPISEWHQLNLLCLLAHQPISGEKGIFNWLSSSNDTVVQFSLKLISEQHAVEFHDDVVKCLNHPNEVVRKEAILCLGQMPSGVAASELSTLYVTEPDKNIQLCIINEFKNTGSEENLPFLHSLQEAEDCDIKLAANKTVLYLQKNFSGL